MSKKSNESKSKPNISHLLAVLAYGARYNAPVTLRPKELHYLTYLVENDNN